LGEGVSVNKNMTKYYFENDFVEFLDYIKSFRVVRKKYSAGDIISSQAETLNNGYYIESGIMKLSIGLSDESEKT
jgi:CRP-like cAMP-binding protein